MARRRFKKMTSRVRTVYKKSYRKSHSSASNPIKLILPAMAYGAGRQYLSNMAKPLTDKLPLGNYADEVVFGVAGYFIAKKNLFGMRKLGEAMMIVEAASVGNQLVGSMGTQTQTVSSGYVYG